MTGVNKSRRKDERGITIILVAFSLLALLGMAALAIDVSTLYVAHGEAQRAANAAALAGARMFAFSGYTSVSTPSPSTPAAADVCQTAAPGADAAANRQAEAVAAQNLVAGQPAAVQSIACNTTAANPQITVTIQRTGLPTFFGRIWGGAANSVTATAVAEAYNPSGSTAPIQVLGVKPWLIPNCDPTTAGPGDCALGGRFVDNITGAIQNNGSFVGKTITLTHVAGAATPNVSTTLPFLTLDYYRANVPINPPAPVCPSTSAVGCSQVGSDDYLDNIACASAYQFSCGQIVGAGQAVSVQTGGGLGVETNEGTQCLIHATGQGTGFGQDVLTDVGNSPPVTIAGGDNNPNPLLQGITSISRSDSIVTLPIYHQAAGPNLCPGGCTQTATIVGFLQVGITQNVPNATSPPGAVANGKIEGVIMNVAGCNSGAGGTAVSGGGVSPIPVRLIHQ
ncbi:MAG TPA: pilus assembly protein TadG-related protein [Terriglobales bacterium]|nr:pilus assembly protein TadG-related protein [Terriglobales bacterium]